MKQLITLFILGFILSFPVISTAQNNEPIYSKAKIYINDNNKDLVRLMKNGIAADEGSIKENTFIESVFSAEEIEKAKSLGYQVDILIQDMTKYYLENVKFAPQSVRNGKPCSGGTTIKYNTPTHFNLGSMGGFLTLNQMLAELDEMHSLYPNLITVKSPISNFKTYENRNIYWVKISDNPNTSETSEPQILFDAIHHAREPESMQQLIFFMWYLLENYATNNEIKQLVDNTEIFCIPIVNPDGYAENVSSHPSGGGMWRKNKRLNSDGSYGVDNNRNYSYHWGESGVSTNPSGQTWPGTAAFTEKENQAMKWFCEQHNFIMALNNHTAAGLLLYPFSYATIQTPDNNIFEAISSLMVSQNGYTNQLSADLYPAAGDADDWMYAETSTHNKIFSMTAEIGHSFWPSQSDIIPIAKNMMFFNLTAVQLVHNFAYLSDINANYAGTNGTVSYKIKRMGLSGNGNFSVSIVPVSSNITSVGSPNAHNGMTMLQETTANISFVLDNNIQTGDQISFDLVMNNGLFDTKKHITMPYGNPTDIFTDDGDASASHWNNSGWGTSHTVYHSPSSSITDSPSGNYPNSTNSSITSATPIDLTTAVKAELSFFAKWEIEDNWDYAQLQVSTDNGNTWIAQCGQYTNEGSSHQDQGEPLYDGTKHTWVKETISLSNYIGQQILFRFRLVSDNSINKDGFYFDDLKVSVLSPTSAVAENNLTGINIYPNPSDSTIQIKLPSNKQKFNMDIYDVAGQLIMQQTVSNSEQIDISRMNKGLYFIRIYSDKVSRNIKFIKK